jgi:hypothetical protein
MLGTFFADVIAMPLYMSQRCLSQWLNAAAVVYEVFAMPVTKSLMTSESKT